MVVASKMFAYACFYYGVIDICKKKHQNVKNEAELKAQRECWGLTFTLFLLCAPTLVSSLAPKQVNYNPKFWLIPK